MEQTKKRFRGIPRNLYSSSLHKIVNAVIVTVNPIKERIVGTSEKKRSPNIVAADGSAPADKIATVPASTYFNAIVYKIYGNAVVTTACKNMKILFSTGAAFIKSTNVPHSDNGAVKRARNSKL